MSLHFTSADIRQRYDTGAARYDRREGIFEVLGVARLRRRLLRRASGRVLDVAAGTGKNLPYYSHSCQITAVDLSPVMLRIARTRAAKLVLSAEFLEMDAQALKFPDHTFDTVVSTLSTCTFPDPVAALREMERVCRPDGHILLLEHGRSSRPRLGRLQDRLARRHARELGCRWNLESLQLMRQAGLRVVASTRHFFGVFYVIIAAPPAQRSPMPR